jgi:hypothetical protein
MDRPVRSRCADFAAENVATKSATFGGSNCVSKRTSDPSTVSAPLPTVAVPPVCTQFVGSAVPENVSMRPPAAPVAGRQHATSPFPRANRAAGADCAGEEIGRDVVHRLDDAAVFSLCT